MSTIEKEDKMLTNKRLNLKYGLLIIVFIFLAILLYQFYFLNLNINRKVIFNKYFKAIGGFKCEETLKLITISPNGEELYALTYSGKIHSYSVIDGKQIGIVCDLNDKLYNPIYMYIDESKTLYFLDNEVPGEPRAFYLSDSKFPIVLPRTNSHFYPPQVEYLGNYKMKYFDMNKKHLEEFQLTNLHLSIFPTLKPSPQSKLIFVGDQLYFLSSSLIDLKDFSSNFKPIPFSMYGKNKLQYMNLETKEINTYCETPPSSAVIISFDIQEDKLVLLTRTNKREPKQVGNELYIYNYKKRTIEKQFSLKFDYDDIYVLSADKLIAVNENSLLLINPYKPRELAKIGVSTSQSWLVKNPNGLYLIKEDENNDAQYHIFKFSK
jgi:hypothetical protein